MLDSISSSLVHGYFIFRMVYNRRACAVVEGPIYRLKYNSVARQAKPFTFSTFEMYAELSQFVRSVMFIFVGQYFVPSGV